MYESIIRTAVIGNVLAAPWTVVEQMAASRTNNNAFTGFKAG